MKVAYLSNRPDVFIETWFHVQRFMPFVDGAVVVTPKKHASRLEGIADVEVVTDEELTGMTASQLAETNHVRLNFMLRRALVASQQLPSEFLMSDDDYRPLKEITVDLFKKDGQDVGFYCYDMRSWPGDSTPFDEAQHVSGAAMMFLGCDTKSFASHMPQMVNTELFGAVCNELATISDDTMFDEWSVYFNLGRLLSPETFAEPQPFVTLGWPQYRHEWPWWVQPQEYAFENFYPELYHDGHLFDGLPTATSSDDQAVLKTNFEKIRRWTAFGRNARQLNFPDNVNNPWTDDSSLRRGAFSTLKQLRKAYGYISGDDHQAITELQGAIARLTEELNRVDRTR